MRENGFTLALGVFALHLLGPGAVQGDFALSVSPTLAEFTADPGSTAVEPITLSNEGSDPIRVNVSVLDLFEAREDLSAIAWFEVSPTELEISPGETKQVEVRRDRPSDASEGGHYVRVVFQAGPALQTGLEGFAGGGAGVGARIESIFLMTIKSASLVLDGSIQNVVPIARGLDTLGFRVEVRNAGNVHFYPQGWLDVIDPLGNSLGRLVLPDTPPVYPGTSRAFDFAGVVTVPPDDYDLATNVSYGWEPWQVDLLGLDPQDWAARESRTDTTFNSVPQLRITDLHLIAPEEQPMQLVFDLENVGDVETAPVGWIGIFDENGEQVFIVDICGRRPAGPAAFSGLNCPGVHEQLASGRLLHRRRT